MQCQFRRHCFDVYRMTHLEFALVIQSWLLNRVHLTISRNILANEVIFLAHTVSSCAFFHFVFCDARHGCFFFLAWVKPSMDTCRQ